MQGLTSDQTAFFAEEGYLMIPDAFDPAELEPVRQELAGVVDREARRAFEAGLLPELYEQETFETRLTRLCQHTDAVYRGVMGKGGGGHAGEELFKIITHPKLLAKVESLIGPEIVGSSVYRIRPKVPGWPHGVVAWHQDSGYFAAHCDDRLILTCWMPLVDATMENGCLWVLPRAHRREMVFRHHTGGYAGYLVITDDDLPEGEGIPVPVPRGGVLFLTNLTPHCSKENPSDVVRWSLDLRYQDARVPNNAGQMPEEFDPETPAGELACYPPEGDFVIRSREHPERVVDYLRFEAIRRAYNDARHLPGPRRGWQPVPR
jgi:phytanoyl-CoA hydroxylase